MIRITCEPQKYSMTVEGHSGSAPKGEDLICAAVSIVTLTLAEMVVTVCTDREVTVRDGYARIRGGKAAAQYFDFARTAFKALSAEYPEHVLLVDHYA